MSVNSSSTSNFLYMCPSVEVSTYMHNTAVALRILLFLPLSTFILYLGHQRWRQRSSKSATHSDIFTYHVAVMELIWVLGSFCLFGGTYTNHSAMILIGLYLSSIPFSGELYFHILTCVERYLAVVHPITYRGLRNARGVRIRNICIGCVWFLCFGLIGGLIRSPPAYAVISSLCFLVFSIIIMSFCSLSVLCVLNRPGPGEGDGKKQRVDQSKQRAFYTITAISVTVWFWFVWLLVYQVVNMSPLLRHHLGCVVSLIVGWLSLPCSLVSPLLYLHRAGKLSCCF